jgi:CubicO group peptidase (beta-lactamase class C family)
MKNIVKRSLTLILIVGLIYGLNYGRKAIPIISGYGAKNLCSCVFVAGREESSVRDNELNTSPLLSAGTFEVNYQDSSVTGNVLGLSQKKAIYRKELGCTLITEISENEVRDQKVNLRPLTSSSDSIPWPYGKIVKDTLLQDVDYNKLNVAMNAAFDEYIPNVKINTRGVVVVYKGQLIGEKYASSFTKDTPQMGWSMTKSVTATLLSMLAKDGKMVLDATAPVELWKDDERNQITTDQLLRMSSGLDWEEVYSGPSSAVSMLYNKADMGAYAADRPLEFQPDEKWYYSSGTSNILSKIIRKTVGEEEYLNYVRDRLFSPLGMTSAVIEPDASGTYVGSSYMYATPRDWAKFGLLYLNDGVWNGKRLLPEGWTKYVATVTDKAPKGEYGAHFWLNSTEKSEECFCYYPDAPKDLYSANGFEGQRVFIIPSKDMVIVRMGQTKGREDFDFNKFLKEIIDSVE